MRAHRLPLLILALAALPAAYGQIGPPGDGAGFSGGGAVQLAQFQPGIAPRASSFDLAPGQAYQIALNCIDLFADTPTAQVAFQAPGSEATVLMASGQELSLGDALARGLLQVRGRGPRDPGPREEGPWYDVVVANLSPLPARVQLPAGTVFVPDGQPVPDVQPGVRRLLAAAQARGLVGSATLAEAVWATRGFTREDVAHVAASPLSDAEAGRVQALLTAANLGYVFDPHSVDYARLYQQRRAALGTATPAAGAVRLPDGRKFQAELTADASGHAVVSLTSSNAGRPLYYAGQILARHSDRWTVRLLQLKTGRPLEAVPGPITVTLAAG